MRGFGLTRIGPGVCWYGVVLEMMYSLIGRRVDQGPNQTFPWRSWGLHGNIQRNIAMPEAPNPLRGSPYWIDSVGPNGNFSNRP